MKRRYLFLGIAVLLLALLNLRQWGGSDAVKRDRPAGPTGSFRPEDFQLRLGFANVESSRSSRDIFQPWRPPAPPPVVKKVEAPPPPPAGPPPKTPEQIAEEAARAELARIKVVGVVFRGKEWQAFLVKGDQLYMAHAGEKVGERFKVEAIRADGVQLLDPVTRVSGQVPVSGR